VNEAEAIKREGGILLRINWPDAPNTSTHPSETELDDYEGFNHVWDKPEGLSLEVHDRQAKSMIKWLREKADG
jgi:hypothetical protein